MIVALFALLWLLVIRPQRRRQPSSRQLLRASTSGDEVLTAGGLYGDVSEVLDDEDLRARDRARRGVCEGRAAVAVARRGRGGRRRGRDEPEPSGPRGARAGRGLSSREERAGAPRRIANPSLTCLAAFVNRSPHLILVGLIVGALIGVAALAIPASPLYQAPTLGLDLQGGLEVCSRPCRRANRPLAGADLDRSRRDHPQPRRQARRRRAGDPQAGRRPDRRSSCRASRTPSRSSRCSARPPSSSSSTSRTTSSGPSHRREQVPGPTESLYDLLSPASRPSSKRRSRATSWYLFDRQEEAPRGPGATREALLKSGRGARDRPPRTCRRRRRREGDRAERAAEGLATFGVPPNTVVVSLRHRRGRLPRRQRASNPTQDFYYLFKYDRSPQAVEHRDCVPQMTGADLGSRAPARTSTRRRASPSC